MTDWTKVHEALDWIVKNENRWNQSFWAEFNTMWDAEQGNFCKTQFCLAGTVCLLNDKVEYKWSEPRNMFVIKLNTNRYDWDDVARKTLELTSHQSDVIFSSVTPDGVTDDVWDTPELYRAFVLAFLQGEIEVEDEVLTESSEGTWRAIYERVSQDLDRSGG